MATSGTYSFSPSFGDVVQLAFSRVGVKRTEILAQHLTDAAYEGNFLLTEWANKQPLLWKSELISQALTQGTATYTLPARVVMVLACYIETGSGTSLNDRIIGPLSTVEYASIPNKTTQAPPTSFWFDRQTTPQITFWQVPDGNGPYTAYMRCVSQAQDASIANGTTLDIPYRAVDAFVAGLAHRLSRIYAPQLEAQRKADAMEAWQIFAGNDVENTPMFLSPGLSTYYR